MRNLLSLALLVAVADAMTNNTEAIMNANNIPRRFEVDYENNIFRMDGDKFRFISGSFHYFRSLPDTWRIKLRTMRAAGLNAVATYVEWSLHNPRENITEWSGMANLTQFLEIAAEEDLYVILRPGPYICAERDNGGFPVWLYSKYPKIVLRTYNRPYRREVRRWYKKLMPRIQNYLYGNGGPIIMVQVENEYGSYSTCDHNYTQWLKNETAKYVGDKAVLFTNDGPDEVACGKIEGVLATLDFGPATINYTDNCWEKLRKYQPKGPLVVAEFYPGWLTHWQEPLSLVATETILPALEHLLMADVNINFYMFYGGSNFGFTAGANTGGPGSFNTDITSYDYDAPITEAGDVTPKYYAIRNMLAKYVPLPNIPVPEPQPKISIPSIALKSSAVILSETGRIGMASYSVFSESPLTFEALNQSTGLVLYETTLPNIKRDPSLLQIKGLHDRAYVYIDRYLIGILARENLVDSLPIPLGSGSKLQILVENEGHINFGDLNDFKGILQGVLLNGHELKNWTITGYSLDDYEKIRSTIDQAGLQIMEEDSQLRQSIIKTGPTIFYGEFMVPSGIAHDTYFDPTGWGKGIVFLNGFNLGRYWPIVGPQVTLYVPKQLLIANGTNEIVLIEYQRVSSEGVISFVNTPNLTGYKSFF